MVEEGEEADRDEDSVAAAPPPPLLLMLSSASSRRRRTAGNVGTVDVPVGTCSAPETSTTSAATLGAGAEGFVRAATPVK
jgi:hypothetical protein